MEPPYGTWTIFVILILKSISPVSTLKRNHALQPVKLAIIIIVEYYFMLVFKSGVEKLRTHHKNNL